MSDIKRDEYRKLLAAWTPTVYKGSYPPYVNVTQVGTRVEITIRGPVKKDGTVGDSIMVEVNSWTCEWIGKVLQEAASKYEVGEPGRWIESTPRSET